MCKRQVLVKPTAPAHTQPLAFPGQHHHHHQPAVSSAALQGWEGAHISTERKKSATARAERETKQKTSKPERNQDYRARAITCPAPTPGQGDSFPKEALGRLEAAPEPGALAANLPRGKAATG